MATPYVDRPLMANIIDPATAPFFEAAKAGRFLIKRCTACSKPHWYPRPLCPYCLGDTEWIEASGQGTIYSVSVTRRAGPQAYAIAYVRLAEGVTMLTNIVDADLDSLKIGQAVTVTFKATESDGVMPMFKPVA
jgi:uncharacterized protein